MAFTMQPTNPPSSSSNIKTVIVLTVVFGVLLIAFGLSMIYWLYMKINRQSNGERSATRLEKGEEPTQPFVQTSPRTSPRPRRQEIFGTRSPVDFGGQRRPEIRVPKPVYRDQQMRPAYTSDGVNDRRSWASLRRPFRSREPYPNR